MSNCWLFQAVPERFDFDGFITSEPTYCEWFAKRGARQMQVGDNVFLWRGKGRQPALAGLVGLATIVGKARTKRDDSLSSGFWTDQHDANLAVLRVPIRILATSARPIDYDMLKADPALRDMGIFTQRQGSNFKLTEAQANTLGGYWSLYSR
jgi:predicted RNA-binding protein with PUA-like domain